MRLPLQNLWATGTTEMPLALLPFSQYVLPLIVAVVVAGWALAGSPHEPGGRGACIREAPRSASPSCS